MPNIRCILCPHKITKAYNEGKAYANIYISNTRHCIKDEVMAAAPRWGLDPNVLLKDKKLMLPIIKELAETSQDMLIEYLHQQARETIHNIIAAEKEKDGELLRWRTK